MPLERTFRTWTRRWWGDQRTLDVHPSIQPVVLVDDVRSLQLRPMNSQFVVYMDQVAVVAANAALVLRPNQIPLRVMSVRATATGLIRCGVMRIDQATGVFAVYTVTDTAQATQMQSPMPFNFGDAVCDIGTHTGAVLFGDDHSGKLASNSLTEIDTVVLPGQFFFLANETQNQLFTVNWLRWEELPITADSIQTSSGVGLGL